YLVDFIDGHFVGAVRIVVGGQAGGAPMRLEGEVGIAVGADMVDLLDRHRPGGLDFIGDLAEMRDDRIAFMGDISAGQNPGSMGRNRLTNHHGGTAKRPFYKVFSLSWAGDA